MRHDRNIVPEDQPWSQFLLSATIPATAASLPARALASTITAGTWMTATAVTTLLHVGLYVALTATDSTPPPPQQMPIAMMIEMSPIALSPQSTLDNADRGPEAVASDAMEEAQKTPPPPPEIAEDIPILPETPPDAKSDILLPEIKKTAEKAPEEPVKEPPPEEPPPKEEIKKEQPKQQIKQLAAKNSGGPKSVTVAPRLSGGNPTWMADVRARVVRAKVYPSDARSQGRTGAALVAVVISGSGQLISAALVSSSRVPSLDAEAVAVMRRAAPYPPTPDGRPATMRIPVAFTIR